MFQSKGVYPDGKTQLLVPKAYWATHLIPRCCRQNFIAVIGVPLSFQIINNVNAYKIGIRFKFQGNINEIRWIEDACEGSFTLMFSQ
jgi:hypothetical protein